MYLNDQKGSLVPDIAICERCLSELTDPGNRRFGHAFISCPDCGPRYSITTGPPFDRPNTTMASFLMCPECEREYHAPDNIRFHDHLIACPACGPRLRLVDAENRELSGPVIAQASEFLCQGNILALKDLGGFHLFVNAEDQAAVLRLRKNKQRNEKPLAVMVRDIGAARRIALLDPAAESLLTSVGSPVVLAPMRPDHELAEAVAPAMDRFGVMLAHTALHHLLMEKGPAVLAFSSANFSGQPICKSGQSALQNLGHLADFFLLHNRRIHSRADDSIAMSALGLPRLIRRSRGYAPAPVSLKNHGPDVLALGADMQNSVCLTKGNQAYLSPQVGDLQNAETLDYYLGIIEKLQNLAPAKPEAVAADLNPDYLSTRQAVQFKHLPLVRVQHHAAHALSAMAELGLQGPVIALILDGGGYGLDGTVWGCEILRVGAGGMKRMGRLCPASLPGGERAALEPWRSALGRLYACYGPDWQNQVPEKAGDFIRQNLDPHALAMLQQDLQSGVNAPRCSALGRLVDAVAALCGLQLKAAYAGQAAMSLEALADDKEPSAYALNISARIPGPAPGLMELDPKPLVDALLLDLQNNAPLKTISARFHNGLINALALAAAWAAQSSGLKHVVLSGGCLTNRILLNGLSQRLHDLGLEPYTHTQAPSGDSGISLGQALGARLALAAGDPDLWTKETG